MSRKPTSYSQQQKAFEEQQATNRTGLSSQQRSKLQNIVDKGKDLQRRISDARSDIRSQYSNDSFHTNELQDAHGPTQQNVALQQRVQNNQQQYQQQQILLSKSRVTSQPPTKNYSLVVQSNRVKLDAVEELLQQAENQPKVVMQPQASPSSPEVGKMKKNQKRETNLNENLQPESDPEPELFKAEAVLISMNQLSFLSTKQIIINDKKDIDEFDFKFRLQLLIDGQTPVHLVDFDLKAKLSYSYQQFMKNTQNFKQQPSFDLSFMPDIQYQKTIKSQNGTYYQYGIVLNINSACQYYEGAGIQFQLTGSVASNTIFAQLCQQNFMRSPYQQLQYNGELIHHNNYLLRNEQPEILQNCDSNQFVVQFNKQQLPIVDMLPYNKLAEIRFLPLEIDFETVICSSMLNCQKLIQNYSEVSSLEQRLQQNTNILLQYQQLQVKQTCEAGVQYDSEMYDQGLNQRLIAKNGLLYDPQDGQYYCKENDVQDAKQLVRHSQLMQVKEKAQADKVYDYSSVSTQLSSQAEQKQQTEMPRLFIQKMELQCLPKELTTIDTIDVQFISKEITIQRDIPLVQGNGLITGNVFSQPIDRYVVPPLNIKVFVDQQQFYTSFTLQDFAMNTAIERWVDLEPYGRLFIKAVCLPGINYNINRNLYKFVDCNGRELPQGYQEFSAPPNFGLRNSQLYPQIPAATQPNSEAIANKMPIRPLEPYKPLVIPEFGDDISQIGNNLEKMINQTFQSDLTDSFNVSVGHEVHIGDRGYVDKQLEQKFRSKDEQQSSVKSLQKEMPKDDSISFNEIDQQVDDHIRSALEVQKKLAKPETIPRPKYIPKAVSEEISPVVKQQVIPAKLSYNVVTDAQLSESSSDVDTRPPRPSSLYFKAMAKKIFKDQVGSSSSASD